MKKVIKSVLALMVLGGTYPAMAQETKDEIKITKKEKEAQEIIIRKKGDKDVNITVQVKGDEVLVNGKPLSEYKGEDVTVSKRKVHFFGNGSMTMNIDGKDFDTKRFFNGMGDAKGFEFWNNENGAKEEKYTFLGVTTDEDENGAKVISVSEESGAAKAGLKEGDIIIKAGDKKIENPADLSEVIRGMKPNDEVKITYKRDGKENTVKAKLSEKVEKNVRVFSMAGPGQKNWAQGFNFDDNRAMAIPRIRNMNVNGNGAFNFDNNHNMNGVFNLDNIAAMGRSRLGLKIQDLEEGEGVKVLALDDETAAAKAGLQKDDVITEIDGKKISNTDDAREQLKPSAEKKSYSIKAKRNGSTMTFEVKVPKKIKTASF